MLSITFVNVVRQSRASPAGWARTVATACPMEPPPPPILKPCMACAAAATPPPAAGLGVAVPGAGVAPAAVAGAALAAGGAGDPFWAAWTTTVRPSLSLHSWRAWLSLLRMRPWKMIRFGSTPNCDLLVSAA